MKRVTSDAEVIARAEERIRAEATKAGGVRHRKKEGSQVRSYVEG